MRISDWSSDVCSSDLAPLAALAAAAPAATQSAAPDSIAGEVIGILLPLALVIIVLVAVLYLVRRRFGLTGQDAPLSILQILPVGSRERIVVVKSRSGDRKSTRLNSSH